MWRDAFKSREDSRSSTEIQNTEEWLDETLANPSAKIVVSPTVLCEFIRHLYFERKYSQKNVRITLRTLVKSYNIEIDSQDEASLFDIVNLLKQVNQDANIDVGELSLVAFIDIQDATFVSSDIGALAGFNFMSRVDPRKKPFIVIPPTA